MIGKFESSKKIARYSILLASLVIFLSACGTGAVQFAPTPLPPDTSPLTYAHPSGAFSITLPRDWAIFEQNLTTFASASFSPPASNRPVLHIAVASTPPTDDINALITRYQTQIRPNRTRYTEQERQRMPDNSWRITATLQDALGIPQPINTFIHYDGARLAVIDVAIPADNALLIALENAVNTFTLHPDTTFTSDAEALTRSASLRLEPINVHLWTNAEGVFFITGEIANHAETPLNPVPVQAVLLAEDGSQVAGAITTTMGHGITPSGFAPFGLRFGQGQPFDARTFRLIIGADDWLPDATLSPITIPDITWTDAIQISNEGQIFITGIVENRSQQTLADVRVIVTILDEEGHVIGASFANADAPLLAPDQQANYVVLVPEVGGVPANYIVNVQAIPCDGQAC